MAYLKALSIDHANMNVKNLEESVDFYSTLFGFELKKDQPDQQLKNHRQRNDQVVPLPAPGLDIFEGDQSYWIPYRELR